MSLYSDTVSVEVASMLSGKHTDTESLAELKQSTIGVLREWANEDDLQYLRVCSTNIGFVRTYQKQFERIAEAAEAAERGEG
jgi:hypothetical protein